MAAASKDASAEMNVTPMIDILLVLLVIFMVSQPNRMALEVQVPPPESAPDRPAPPPHPAIVVELAADGGVALNGQPVAGADLPNLVRAALEHRGMKVVYVKAHPDRRYQEVVTAVDVVRGAGADVVAFMPR